MDIKNKEAFESKFKLNAIYERESRIRKNNILEFAETAGIYFNIVTNNAWELWQAAQAQAVPESNALLSAAMDAVQKLGSGDFVLVPKKPDVDKAWSIALKRIVPPPKTNDAIQQELMCKKYVDDLCSEQDRILLDYEAMIEAQEQSHD